MLLKTTQFIILFDLVAISDSVYTALLPYFSPVAMEKGFTETEIGIMLAFYPIGSVIATPLVSLCSSKRKAILIGLVQSSLATLGIGLSKFTEGGLFFASSCIFRIIIGSGASFLLIPSYSSVPILFKDQVTKKIAILEIGHCVGRLISTGFFTMIAQMVQFDTYQLPCYGLAFVYAISCLITYRYFFLSEVPEGISPKKQQKKSIEFQKKQSNQPINQSSLTQTITPIEILVQNDNSLIQQNDDLNQSQQQLQPNDLNQTSQNFQTNYQNDTEQKEKRCDTKIQTLEVPQLHLFQNNNSSGGEDKVEENDNTINQLKEINEEEKKAIKKLQTQIRAIIKQQKEGKEIVIPDSPKMKNSQNSNTHNKLSESGNKMQISTQFETLPEIEEQVESESESKLSFQDYIEMIKNKQIVVTFIFFFWLSALENGLRPFLSIELSEVYGLSEYNISYLFMLAIFTYLLSVILVARQSYFTEYILFIIGQWILALSFYFYCPTLYEFPESLGFIIFGEILRGISLGIGCALFIPNITTSCINEFGLCKANLIGSNLYQFAWALGDIFGPILCGAFVEKIGYEITTLCSGFVIVVFAIIYLIIRKRTNQCVPVKNGAEVTKPPNAVDT